MKLFTTAGFTFLWFSHVDGVPPFHGLVGVVGRSRCKKKCGNSGHFLGGLKFLGVHPWRGPRDDLGTPHGAPPPGDWGRPNNNDNFNMKCRGGHPSVSSGLMGHPGIGII